MDLKFDNVDRKLNTITDQVGELLEFKTETKEKLDPLLENQVSIYEILGRHDVEISNLKRKTG